MSPTKIIAGTARGRSLVTLDPKNEFLRPILGRIKKSLFDILYSKLEGSSFLDLYAGTGAVGCEALSRGCKKVVFVDRNEMAVSIIKKNLVQFGWVEKAEVLGIDIARGLNFIREKFDIIFLGPPYKDDNKVPLQLTAKALEYIVNADLLAEKGWTVAQHHKTEVIIVPEKLQLFREEAYGDTVVSFYRASGSEQH